MGNRPAIQGQYVNAGRQLIFSDPTAKPFRPLGEIPLGIEFVGGPLGPPTDLVVMGGIEPPTYGL